jgi:hypothetical protein
MPWKESSLMDEGLQFVARRLAGQPMVELCHVAVSDPVRSVLHAGVHPEWISASSREHTSHVNCGHA